MSFLVVAGRTFQLVAGLAGITNTGLLISARVQQKTKSNAGDEYPPHTVIFKWVDVSLQDGLFEPWPLGDADHFDAFLSGVFPDPPPGITAEEAQALYVKGEKHRAITSHIKQGGKKVTSKELKFKRAPPVYTEYYSHRILCPDDFPKTGNIKVRVDWRAVMRPIVDFDDSFKLTLGTRVSIQVRVSGKNQNDPFAGHVCATRTVDINMMEMTTIAQIQEPASWNTIPSTEVAFPASDLYTGLNEDNNSPLVGQRYQHDTPVEKIEIVVYYRNPRLATYLLPPSLQHRVTVIWSPEPPKSPLLATEQIRL